MMHQMYSTSQRLFLWINLGNKLGGTAMIIGGKRYEIGQHVRIISAKSVLHYIYGLNGHENERLKGVSGIIVSESHYNRNAVCNMKVDEQYEKNYKNGMTRIFKDDEIELID